MRYEDASLSGSFQDQGPTARDDSEQLAAGERGPATGNVITGAGTESGAAGADAAAGAKITALAGAGGSDTSFDGGRLRVEGEHGTLSLTAKGDYSYTAKAGVPENSRDTFTYTLADASGASSQARLTIEIGKTQAVVKADAQRIIPGPDGVVVLPAGVELSDIRIVGRDLLVMLPDGTQMLIVDGAVFVPQLVINDIEVPSTNLAALLIDQEPRPASGVPQSSGGNFIEAVGPLDPGTPLGDLLPPTQLGYIPPEFQEVFLVEDREPEVGENPLIQLDDDARPGGNAGGTGDDPDSVNATGTLSGSGGDGQLTFALSTAGAPAGFAYVSGANGSLLVQQNGVTVMTITVNAQTGAYTVTQNAPIAHPAGEAENNVVFTFGYSVTDSDGDQALGTFQVNVDDDTPTLGGAAGGAGVTIDESAAVTPAGFPISATSASAVIVGTGVSFGADGAAASGANSYGLALAGNGSTSLRTAQGDYAITLVQTSGSVITGTYNDGTGTKTAFTLTIGADGKLTVQQSVALEHNVDGSTAAAYDDSLDLSGLVNATLTIRDGDGDTATASAAIGNLIVFKDDGPDSSLAVEGARPTLVLDETLPAGSDTAGAGAPGGLASVSAGFSGSFNAVKYGADGAGSTSYALVLNGTNVASGMYVLQVGDVSTADGDPLGRGAEILLNQSGNTITGSAGGVNYFTITIDPASGVVTFTQLQPVWNPTGGTSYDEAAILNAATGALLVQQTVVDSDGDSDSSALDVSKGFFQIQDDGPVARNDADQIAAGTYGPETGNVITGAGTSTSGADTVGRDGATVVAVSAGEASDSSFDEAGNLVISGQYGVLTIKADGSYSYVRNAGTPGGVSDSFVYTLRDTDGDTSSATLTISIGNLPPTVNAPDADAPGTVVYEAALGGSPEGSGEEAAPGANGDPRETTTGTISFTPGDGPAVVTIAGVTVTGVGQVIDTGEGLLTITATTGTSVSYSYTLKDNLLVPGTSSDDSIAVTVTDQDGQTATDTLVIKIVDDAPDARNDTDSIAAGSYGPETGNVISGAGTVSGDAGKDTQGADGASVVAVSGVTSDSSFDEAGNLVVNGQYGVLTIKADGSYSYVRNAGTPGGVTDVFTYTLRDGDGDQDTATLTINIGNNVPTIDAPNADAPGTIVFEKGLSGARGPGESEGTGEAVAAGVNGDPSESTSGSISYTPGDGPSTITIAGVAVASVGQVIDTGEGLLTITSIGAGAIGYSYTLKDNLLVSGASTTDSIAVTITDQDGSTASDTLVITIVDDAPDALNDTDAMAAGSYGPETGNVLTGAGTTSGDAGKDLLGADGSTVVAAAGVTSDSSFDEAGNLVVNGQYGVLTIKADGSYSYVRNAGTPGGVTDVFSYTIRDADGDQDTATLTISIGDAQPFVAPNPVVQLDDDALAGGNPGGVGDDPDSANVSGTLQGGGGDSPVSFSMISLTSPAGFSPTLVNPNLLEIRQGGVLVLTITLNNQTGAYTVVQNAPIAHAAGGDENDVQLTLGYRVTDVDGDIASGTLVIKVDDDTPVAFNDIDSVGAGTGPATGNVLTGIDVAGGDANSSDGVADRPGADGGSLVAVASVNVPANSDSSFEGGNLVVAGQYGTLTIKADGSYSYVRFDGSPITASDVFRYTLRDGDGDETTATLTIGINDQGVTTTIPAAGGATTTVFEAGLGTRPGEPAGSGEIADGNAGNNSDPREAVSGSIAFTAPDGLGSISLGGTVINLAGGFPQTVSTNATGTLVVTGYSFNAATGVGSLSYTYTLADNTIGAVPPASGDASQSFALVVTDSDGDNSGGNLVISIVDDVPTARNDVDSVGATTGPATGNVITGVDVAGGDANATDGVADVQGADGASVVQIASNNVPANVDNVFEAGNLVVAGQYGTLTIKADGSYSYVRFNGAPLTANDVFTYTLRDGDGDLSTATLTIGITDNGVTTTIPAAGGATTTVYEAGLGTRPGEPAGSGEIADGNAGNNSDPREAVSGSIAFTAPDGLGSVSLGGTVINLGGTFPQTVSTNPTGTLVVTGVSYNAATGIGSISYTYTLADNTIGAVPPASGDTSQSFALVVTDSDGDTSGGNLVISIVDDVPTARADTDSVAEGATTGGNVIAGTGTDSGLAGADTLGADGAVVVGVKTGGDTSVAASANVGVQINGTYGKLTLNADGSYSYVANPNSVTTGQQDVFTYTIRDADGDLSTTTLTITVNNVTLPADNQTKSVNEAALDLTKDGADLAAGTVTGSTPASTAETVSGQLSVAGATSYVLNGSATGANGVIQLNSNGSYTYTLTSPFSTVPQANDGAVVSGSNVFTYTATDANGNSVQGTITINIVDDVPTARVDTDTIAAGTFGPELGNVITGAGTTSGAAGADTLGADSAGAAVVGVKAGTDNTAIATGVATSINGQYGVLTLNADGSYSYTRNANTPGGVTDTFSYTLKDGDGDLSVTQLNIVIQDAPVTIDIPPAGGATTTVYEKGLPVRGGETAGSGEIADGNGTNNSDPSEAVSGTISFVSKDGLQGISLGGVALNLSGSYPQTITTAGGQTLVVTGVSYNATTGVGSIAYTYTLTDNTLGNQAVNGGDTNASFAVVVTDKDGDTSPAGNLVITIKDDAPTAANDVDSVGATTGPATGNVITGVDVAGGDANATDGVADVQGADGASVVQIASNNVPANVDNVFEAGNLVVAGQYGTLTIKADGSYSYVRFNGAPLTATDVFTYTLRDGDGDTATATLTINISDNGVTTTIPTAAANTTVYEAALGTRPGEPAGSGEIADGNAGNNSDTREAVSGVINFTAQDGVGSISLGGTVINLGGTFPQTVTTDAFGTLVVTGYTYTAATGAGTLSYTYTLADNTLGAAPPATGNVGFSFALVVTDSDGDSSAGNLVINVVDDAPTAANDIVGQANENQPVTFGVFGNDVFGADNVDTANLAKVTYTQPAQGTVTYDGATGQFTFTPVPGQEGSVTFNYTIEDGDGDKSTATVTINLQQDSVPVVSDAVAKVDDDGLAGGNAGGTGDIDANAGDLGPNTSEAIFQGKINVNWGNDASGSTITFANLNGTTGQVGTETVNYSWSGNTLTASSARGNIFQILVDPATGNYTLTLLKPILHATGGNETSAFVDLNYTATDGDGDSVTTGKLVVEFNDDTPNPFSPSAVTTTNGNTPAVTGNLNLSIGADGFGTLVFDSAINGTAAKDGSGNALTVGGQPLIYVVNGSTLTAQTAGGVVGYVVNLNTNGTYSFNVENVISNGTETTFSNLSSTAAGNVLYRGIGANDAATKIDVLLSGSLGGTSQTVNTDSDSIGTANQSMDPGETLRIDLVSNLTSGAGTTTGFNYDAHVGTTSFDQLIPQVQGNQSEVVSFKVWALNSTTTASQVPDSDPTGGFANSSIIAIKTVTVTDYLSGASTTVNVPLSGTIAVAYGISITVNGDGSITFSGVQEGDRYAIGTGTTEFNAVVVQDSTGSFDLGIFKIGSFSAGTPIVQVLPVIATDADGDSVSSTITATINPAGTTPVTLDLNGDGQIAYLGHEAGVAYDYDADGRSESTGWVGPQDGILVRDSDGNGTVSGSGEFVFGNASTTDLAALRAQYGDALDQNDADYGKFAVWQDANSNGVADAGEVKSLADLGISAINLVGDGQSAVAAGGDVVVVGSTSFVRNGVSQLAQDTIFKVAANDQVRGSEAGANTSVALVAAAAAAAALAAAPAAAEHANAAEPSAPVVNEVAAAAPVAGHVPAGDVAPEQAADGLAVAAASVGGTPAPVSEPVQHFAEAGHSGLEAPQLIEEVAASLPLDRGTELVTGGAPVPTAAELHLPSPEQMAALAGLHSGPVSHDAGLQQVIADALAGGGMQGPDINQLIDVAVKLAEPAPHQQGFEVSMNGEGGHLAELATQLNAAVPAWDGGHFGPLFTALASAMETPALHPDAVQPAANG